MRRIHRFASALALTALCGTTFAQGNYPNKPIRMLIPLAAASAVDNAARVLGARMSENMMVISRSSPPSTTTTRCSRCSPW